jgi:hypothetical protein
MRKRYVHPNDILERLNVEEMRLTCFPAHPVHNIGENSGFKPRQVLWPISRHLIMMFIWRLWMIYVIHD